MMVIISYDISLSDKNGPTRLRKVAKLCQNYGQRVQNSVFECILDNQTFVMLKKQILDVVNLKLDSVRFYLLGNRFDGKIEHYGTKSTIDLNSTLIF
ncbi:MAG: CRISPR-associated endonuclease Cas2 [Christensenellales bacterium]